MKVYADYQFYVDEYKGKMDEIDFHKAIIHSSQYIRHITLGRSDKYDGDELKYVSCALADAYISAYKLSSGNNSPGQKKSENTDGYSVSYVTQGKDGESAEELFKRKAYPLARQWLVNTGLLNRRVGCNHDHKCGLYSL